MAIEPVITTRVNGASNIQAIVSINYDPKRDVLCGGIAIKDLLSGKVQQSREICLPLGDIRNAVLGIMRNNKRAMHGKGANGIGYDDMDIYSRDLWEISGLWDDVKRKANRVTKKVGARKILRMADRLVNDPRFAKLGAMAATIYPPLGLPLITIQQSAKLLKAARAGDRNAQIKLLKLRELAESGDPKAMKVAKAIVVLNQAAKQGKDPEAEVGNWFYNRPYRGNLAASMIDRSNPAHILRKLYHDAVNR